PALRRVPARHPAGQERLGLPLRVLRLHLDLAAGHAVAASPGNARRAKGVPPACSLNPPRPVIRVIPVGNGGNLMYERDISRRDPGCVVFLLDRSDSMKSIWVNTRETLAQGAARVLNEILLELLFTSQGEPGKARHYFDVGIFGYGVRPMAGGEGVEPAFGGKLAGQPLVALPDLRDNPIAVRETPSVDIGAPPSRVPVWVE